MATDYCPHIGDYRGILELLRPLALLSRSANSARIEAMENKTNSLITANFPIPSSLGSLDSYIGFVNQIPVLSVELEQELARQYRDQSDLDAAKSLVMSHLRFVVHVARGYRGYGLPIGDLIQEGNIGLMKAVKRFDPDQGVRLVSFAVHWIRAEMHEFILRNWRIVKVATTKAQRKLFFNLRKSKKRLGWLSADEVSAVAKDLNVTERDVLEMESRLSGSDIGFDAPSDTDDDSTSFAPAGYLEASAHDPAEAYAIDTEESRRHELLQEGLAGLDERSRDILSRRFLGEPKATLQDLADEYGVSAERIRQIENAALKKIRGVFAI